MDRVKAANKLLEASHTVADEGRSRGIRWRAWLLLTGHDSRNHGVDCHAFRLWDMARNTLGRPL